jgi:hypothetical protein
MTTAPTPDPHTPGGPSPAAEPANPATPAEGQATGSGAAAPADPAGGGSAATQDEPGSLDPIEKSTDPVRLVVHAVGQLPPEQRDLVLTWLLRQRPGLSRWTIGARATEHAAELHALQLTAASQLGRGVSSAAQQQVVPVRFPAEQHAQLRQWCSEHGFSMATVIRGLVARFLERQLPDQN